MKQWLGSPMVQIALCAGAYALVGYYFGKAALVMTSPLLGAAITHPLIVLASNIRHRVRAHFWLPVHGPHFVFRDITIHVIEDEEHCRWVNLADVRRVVTAMAAERALSATYGQKFRLMGTPAQAHLRDDALDTHLGKVNEPTALRFRTWVERNIAFPGRRRRMDRGIQGDGGSRDGRA